MKHSEYKQAVEADRKYVQDQLKRWTLAAEQAKEKVDYWTRQDTAMSTVGARVSLGEDTAFNDKKSS